MTGYNLNSPNAEFMTLLAAVCDGCMTPAMWERLNQILAEDPQAREYYILHISHHADLLWHFRDTTPSQGDFKNNNIALPAPRLPISSYLGNACSGVINFFSQEMPLAYTISAVIVALALFIASLIYLPEPTKQFASSGDNNSKAVAATKGQADQERPASADQAMRFVGRITGMVDCEFSDENTIAVAGASVPLGRKYALARGLMEITYHTGAKVILQGPCQYEVNDPAGGYLALGKLTARIEKKNDKNSSSNSKISSVDKKTDNAAIVDKQRLLAGDEKSLSDKQAMLADKKNTVLDEENNVASNRNSSAGKQTDLAEKNELVDNGLTTNVISGRKGEQESITGRRKVSTEPGERDKVERSLSKDSTLAVEKVPEKGLFTITTPTATITDLGTEFGVEVDKQGTTNAQVFRGSISVQASVGGLASGDSRILKDDESVRIEAAENNKPIMRVAASPPGGFVRNLPRREPIRVFNTGEGLKEGQPDPHWQITAISNDPTFQPCPAVVVPAVDIYWLPNTTAQSQWISLGAGGQEGGVSYTFQTTFDLTGLRPETAVLYGRFIADNCVQAIRINGQDVPVPPHDVRGSFDLFRVFVIRDGFREGVNTLTFVVANSAPEAAMTDPGDNPMGLRVELEGSAMQSWKTPKTEASETLQKSPSKGG